jgi:hypothetical protein
VPRRCDNNHTLWKHDGILLDLHHTDKLRGPGFEPISLWYADQGKTPSKYPAGTYASTPASTLRLRNDRAIPALTDSQLRVL